MLDKNYLLRDGTTSVTGTENGTTFDVGMDLVPQTYMLNLPFGGDDHHGCHPGIRR